MSDELVAMMESSPQQPGCSQNLLGIVPAPINDAGSTAELLPCERRPGELQRGGPCQGPGLSSLMCYLGHTNVHYSRGKHCHPFYTRENWALTLFPSKRENLTPRKFIPLWYHTLSASFQYWQSSYPLLSASKLFSNFVLSLPAFHELAIRFLQAVMVTIGLSALAHQ